MHIDQWIGGFFEQKDYSRRGLEGPNPAPVMQLGIFALAGRGKSETLRLIRTHPFFRNFDFASGGDTQRILNNAQTDSEMARAAEMMEAGQNGNDRKTEIALLSKAFPRRPLVLEARMAGPVLTHGGRKACCVKIDCSLSMAASRKFRKHIHENPGSTTTVLEIFEEHDGRDKGDERRLTAAYPQAWWNDDEYDAVVSTVQSPEMVVAEIVSIFDAFCSQNGFDLRASAHERNMVV